MRGLYSNKLPFVGSNRLEVCAQCTYYTSSGDEGVARIAVTRVEWASDT